MKPQNAMIEVKTAQNANFINEEFAKCNVDIKYFVACNVSNDY